MNRITRCYEYIAPDNILTSAVFHNFRDYGKYRIERVACSSTLEHGLSGICVVVIICETLY